MKSLAKAEKNLLAGPFGITATAWQLPEGMDQAEWIDQGHRLARVKEAYGWWLGDWWNYGVRWGDGRQQRLKRLRRQPPR